ncbi:hypothetical protein KBI51_09215 [Aerococcaceae bacterium zg-ZUI334]|nr:hypothetical protein [Aerococcaceae bacterium zg-ZUI334]
MATAVKIEAVSDKNYLKLGATDTVDLDLIRRMIAFNIEEKKDYQKFWR